MQFRENTLGIFILEIISGKSPNTANWACHPEEVPEIQNECPICFCKSSKMAQTLGNN